MCATCGCSRPEVEVESQPEPAGSSEHYVDEDQREPTGNKVAFHAHFNGREDVRLLKLEADILSENRKYAQQNRRYLCERRVGMLNLVLRGTAALLQGTTAFQGGEQDPQAQALEKQHCLPKPSES